MDGAFIIITILGLAWIGSKMIIDKPCLSFGAENLGKVFVYAALADAAIAYAKDQKYIPN